MEHLFSVQTAVLFLALVQVVLLGIFAIGVYMLAKNPNDLDTDEIWDTLGRNQESLKTHAQEIENCYSGIKKMETDVSTLGTQFSELYEFVNRGIKRMSARNQRAEELLAFHEDLNELDAASGSPDQTSMNFEDPNHRGKLVRNGR